jgi:hypothetical protein
MLRLVTASVRSCAALGFQSNNSTSSAFAAAPRKRNCPETSFLKLTRMIIVAILTVCSKAAFAGGLIDNGTVQFVGVGPYYDAVCGYKCMLIAFATPPSASPCTFSADWHFAVNLTAPEGRTTAAVVLAAKTTGNRIQAGGNGICIWNGSRVEELSYIYMK